MGFAVNYVFVFTNTYSVGDSLFEMGSTFFLPSLPAPTFPSHPFSSLLLFSVPLELGPLNPAQGSRKRCKLPYWGLGRSPSRNRIWCIL